MYSPYRKPDGPIFRHHGKTILVNVILCLYSLILMKTLYRNSEDQFLLNSALALKKSGVELSRKRPFRKALPVLLEKNSSRNERTGELNHSISRWKSSVKRITVHATVFDSTSLNHLVIIVAGTGGMKSFT